MDDRGKENLRLTSKRMDLALLAEKLCNVHGVNPGELRSGSRRHEIVKARRVILWLVVKELGYSGAAVARYLGVTNSCITRAVLGEEAPQKERHI
jgi:chromosomal replication initiation ATPase DnaA